MFILFISPELKDTCSCVLIPPFNFQYVLPTAEERRSFALVGYSYGSLIAIELARQLESHGLTGQLVLIDGAPLHLKSMLEQYLPSSTEQELQNNVLLSIMDTLQPAASGKVDLSSIAKILSRSSCNQLQN